MRVQFRRCNPNIALVEHIKTRQCALKPFETIRKIWYFSTRCVFSFPLNHVSCFTTKGGCLVGIKQWKRRCFYEQKKHKNKTPLKLLVLRELELSRLVNAGRAFHIDQARFASFIMYCICTANFEVYRFYKVNQI